MIKKLSAIFSLKSEALSAAVLALSLFVIGGGLAALLISMPAHIDFLTFAAMAQGLFLLIIVSLYAYQSKTLQAFSLQRQRDSVLLESRLMAMEAAHDGICIADHEGNIVYMNKALIDLHGIAQYQAGAYLGSPWAKLYNHAQKEINMQEILADLRARGYWRGEMPVSCEDGRNIYVDLSLTLLPDGGFIGTVRDITEQQKADQEKNELQKQFYQSQKMEAVGRLAGGVAHDFNNILAAINGYAEFLVEDLGEGTTARNFAINILQAGLQARNLVDHMLAFSRRSEHEGQEIDIVIPLLECLSMLSASLPKTIECHTDIVVESAPVKADPTQISQVIMNLGVNAADAMEDERGKLTVALKRVSSEEFEGTARIVESFSDLVKTPLMRIDDMEPGRTRLVLGSFVRGQEYFCLRVTDTGCGMGRTTMEHIFEPFFTTKPVDKGTGLGLAMVHGVVAANQGVMIVDSTLLEGTSFTLFLPAAELLPESKQEQVFLRNIKGTGKILLVEDQESVRDMMMNMLERLGFETQSAENGLIALDIIRENPGGFDLVVTDQNMPKMSGIELVEQVHIDFPDLPFVLVSGYSHEKLEALIGDHPAIKSVLRKPVAKEAMAEKINLVLAAIRRKAA